MKRFNMEAMNKELITKHDLAEYLGVPLWLAKFLLDCSVVFSNIRSKNFKTATTFYWVHEKGVSYHRMNHHIYRVNGNKNNMYPILPL
jgi:hypothetical protein